MKKNIVLVLGGGGYIGSHMVLDLIEKGKNVVVIDDFRTGVTPYQLNPATYLYNDYGNPKLLDQIACNYNVTAVINFAASLTVPESVVNPLKYYQNNVVNTSILLEAWVKYSWGPMIFSGTAAVYGDVSEQAVSEDHPLQPLSPYGWSKLMCERMIIDTAKAHSKAYSILRYFNAAGADPLNRTGLRNNNSQNLFNKICQTSRGYIEKLTVFGTDYHTKDGTCVRDYIHVTDLISAHSLALDDLLENGSSSNDIYNCGYGAGYSVKEVLESYHRVTGKELPHNFGDRRAGDPATIVADANKIKSKLGWSPALNNIDKIMEHSISWDESFFDY